MIVCRSKFFPPSDAGRKIKKSRPWLKNHRDGIYSRGSTLLDPVCYRVPFIIAEARECHSPVFFRAFTIPGSLPDLHKPGYLNSLIA